MQNSGPMMSGFGCAFGAEYEAMHKVSNENKRYFQFLFDRLPDNFEPKDFPSVLHYDGLEILSQDNVCAMFPLYKDLFLLEDIICNQLNVSLPELIEQAQYNFLISHEGVKKISTRFKDILEGKLSIPNFSISQEELDTLVDYWEKTVNRYCPLVPHSVEPITFSYSNNTSTNPSLEGDSLSSNLDDENRRGHKSQPV